jgi:phosphate-selective porin OprO/OprP
MRIAFILLFTFLIVKAKSQSNNDILNLLVVNKSITQEQADSIRAESAINQQTSDAGKKSFQVTAARLLQISGYTQIRYQSLEEKGKNDGYDIRRARVDFTGNFTPYLSYRLMADFADKPKIMDAYADIKINDYLNITIGQFRIPFSVENLTPVRKFDLIDFSQAVDALVFRAKDVIGNQNGRDIGIQLGGAFLKKRAGNLLEYKFGVFNGSGINISDTANAAKDFVGRILVNPFKGLTLGTSYYNGWGKAIKPSSGYAGRSQTRNRFGLEVNYATLRFLARGEYIQGIDGSTEKAGWYLLAGYYIIPQKLQLVFKYDTYDPNTATDNNVTTNYVTGANYNFNNWSRIQAFYTFRQEQGTKTDNNYLSIQFQIGF